MSDADNRHPYQPHPDQGWQPLPQGGEYESEATAFVQLPEGFTSGIYQGRAPRYGTPGAEPLEAPGHGYTPPSSFTPHAGTPPVPDAGADPAATGQWTMPFADPSAGYADPSAGYPAHAEQAPHQGHSTAYHSGTPEAAPPWGEQVDWPVAGSPEAGGTGTWSIPAAADDGPEESGEYLLGDDELTGHTGHSGYAGGYPGVHGYQRHPGHPGHPGPTGHGAAAGYQDGGYPTAYDGAPGPADAEEAARTGHWNFTAGPDAAGGPEAPPAQPQDSAHGEEVHEEAHGPFGVPAGDPYAHERGLSGHGAESEPPGAADPYATGGGRHPAAGEATGHWSLPADALAQWPPATEAAQPSHDGAPERQEAAADLSDAMANMPDMTGTHGWPVPGADGEQPPESDEFAHPDTPAESAAPDDDGAAPDAPQETNGPGAHTEPDAHPAPDDFAGTNDSADSDDLAGPEAFAGPEDGRDAADAAGTDDRTVDSAADRIADGAAGDGESLAGIEPLADAGADAAAPVSGSGLDGHDEHPAASFVLRVNGIDRPVTDAWIGESLLYVLRERLGLAGAKDGCSQGECGACSVQVDGRLVASCLVPAATTAGSEVRTVEGLAENGVPSDVQRALAASGAVQCGFCVPGVAMTVHDLLEGNHAPSELETRKALCGNLCRCSGYRGVLDAVEEVVKARAEAADTAEGEMDGETPADTARIPHQAGPADPMGHAPHDQDPHTGGSA
ncbi:(2Fe-2S)-binding protein [Streptomyces sp. TM32]|uniref:2Fe-2S iron-sulfur cluster-binding protein n=1 Tax=Streptomyces sp. TM32 TaxID=1652669 RepID=UPI001012FCFA|nr:2Fe-2S iron-sulfur cluster-binding protein [Streptomyces sp. TM32]RXS88748.1 (2Fe-2S)-binding protein [Streptomyces sp. TM32]